MFAEHPLKSFTIRNNLLRHLASKSVGPLLRVQLSRIVTPSVSSANLLKHGPWNLPDRSTGAPSTMNLATTCGPVIGSPQCSQRHAADTVTGISANRASTVCSPLARRDHCGDGDDALVLALALALPRP
jgi:hypothetical protein